jgi:biopolymer transport protein TolR
MNLNSSGATGRRRRSSYRAPVAEINVTPFVDVILVLLIVFMVTAPLITQGVQVNLPEVNNAPINEPSEPIQISIKNDGAVYIGEHKVEAGQLNQRLLALRKAKAEAEIILKADTRVPYGKVMEVMGALQSNGLVNVGLVTQPPKGR